MFEWIIPRQSLQRQGDWIQSPVFHQADSLWIMNLNLKINEWVWIYLCRAENGEPKSVTYKIQTKGRTFVKEFTATGCFDKKGAYRAKPIILKKELPLNSNLTITCYMKVAGENVPCTFETKVENSAIEKETPKDNDLSPLQMKEEIVPCPVQQVKNSVFEKEKPKDNGRPLYHRHETLHDMRDDVLLRKHMKNLLTMGNDHDVTICVQDKEFRAHRNILSTRSPVFATMLKETTIKKSKGNNRSTICIEDCDPESFKELLLYVYSGRTENLTPSNALRLYHPADKFDFPALKNRCVSLLQTSLSVETICDVVVLAEKHNEKYLLEVAMKFFTRNMKKIVVTVSWQKFMSMNPVLANKLIIKSMEILHPEN